LHELIVSLHRFKGLDKHGLPGAAGAVHHTLHAAPVLRAHGNHEAVVAQRDIVLARLRLPGPENLLQGALDGLSRLHNAGANPPQGGGRVIADFSVRQHASFDRGLQFPKIRQRRATRGQQRVFCSVFAELLPQPCRSFQQRTGVQKFRWLQNHSRRIQLIQPRRRIGQRSESQFAFRAQPLPSFADQCKGTFQRDAISSRLEFTDMTPARRAGRPQPQQFPQLVEFKYGLRRSRHSLYLPRFHSTARYLAASSGVATVCTRFPLASPQTRDALDDRGPCSTSRTRSRIGCQKFPSTAKGFLAITDLFSISQTTASSTSVPVPPLQATNPSASRINSNSRSSQVFFLTSTSTHWFTLRPKNSAVTPYVFPPASFAPRDAASITPP